MRHDSSTAWAALLASILPEQRCVGLLQAMLWEGPAARDRWNEWAREIGDPRAFFEKDWRGLKGLLALLSHRLRENGIDLGHDFATYARVAELREELRGQSFFDTLRTVQRALDDAGLQPILLNGAAHALTIYAQPLVRHNHGIDLLLPSRQLEEGGRAIERAGFQRERTTTLPRGVVETYHHRTGLELTLRSRLYLTPHVEADSADLQSRCEEVRVENLRVRVLSVADRLCHTLAEGATAPTCRNLRWACDAYLLLRRSAALDYDGVIARAVEAGLALPVAVLLEFFRTELRVEIPADVIAELRRQGVPGGGRRASLLLSMALRTSASVDEFVRRAGAERRLFVTAARFALLPSAEHIAYQRRPTARWRIPWLYAERVGRLLARPVRRGRVPGEAAS